MNAEAGEILVDFEDDEASAAQVLAAPPTASVPQGVNILPTGTLVGNYVVDALIDVGGGGVIYSVRHRTSGAPAALKVLREDVASTPTMMARFGREAQAVSAVQHPNIIDIYEVGEIEPGRPYFVMELLQGTDVRKLLRQNGRFSPEEVLDVFEPLCNAVQAAHEAGIVHRDIKSSNIVLAEKNGQRVVKLVDFGIAKPIVESSGEGLTGPGLLVGTVHNMAPEQIRSGTIDARTDVYALGTLAYQMLTGRYPFDAGDPLEVVRLHLQSPPPRPSASAPVPPALDEVVLRCLEKSPTGRFASVADLLAAFQAALGRARVLAGTPVWGVGIYFEITIGDDEDDDSLFEDMMMVLDMVEQGLGSSSIVCPFRLSNAMLGVRIASDRAEAERHRTEIEAILAQWRRILLNRGAAHPSLGMTASLAVAEGLARPRPSSAASVEIVGGPLLDFGAWKHPRRVKMI